MDHTPPGRFKTIEAFRDRWRELDPERQLDCDLEIGPDGPLSMPLDVVPPDGGIRTIGNRFAVHPMEGWDATPEGGPSEDTLRRWRRFGESGAKLVWGGEAYAVQPDGRANPNQLHLNPDPGVDDAGNLGRLLETLQAGHRERHQTTDDLLVGLQLTHSGRFSRPEGTRMTPRIAELNPVLSAKYGLDASVHILTDGELRTISDNMVKAACLAADVGFDFVDVKCCHGYLLHELLGAHTRRGDFGGSFENRTRLFRDTVRAIRSERPGLLIGCRVSITDTYPMFRRDGDAIGYPKNVSENTPWRHGFGVNPMDPTLSDFTEPQAFLELCRELGVFMANLTVGSPYYCPHLQRPAAYPPSDGYLPPRDPLCEVQRHLQTVRTIKALVPDLPLVGSGWSYLQEWLPFVAQHEVRLGMVDAVGLGRSMLSYPTLPEDVIAGRPLQRKYLCRTFSDCTTAPRNGMISGCYPLDEHYKSMPQSVELKLLRKEASKA